MTAWLFHSKAKPASLRLLTSIWWAAGPEILGRGPLAFKRPPFMAAQGARHAHGAVRSPRVCCGRGSGAVRSPQVRWTWLRFCALASGVDVYASPVDVAQVLCARLRACGRGSVPVRSPQPGCGRLRLSQPVDVAQLREWDVARGCSTSALSPFLAARPAAAGVAQPAAAAGGDASAASEPRFIPMTLSNIGGCDA